MDITIISTLPICGIAVAALPGQVIASKLAVAIAFCLLLGTDRNSDFFHPLHISARLALLTDIDPTGRPSFLRRALLFQILPVPASRR